jgi:hypothetical protein
MAIYETLYPQGNFLDIRANAPTSTDYNIQVMEDLVRNLPGGGIRDLLAPATAATLSLPYDAIQAATRTTEDDISKAMETAGMYGPKDIASEAYGLAFGRERPLSSAIERTIGASGPLAERINNLNLFNSAVAAEMPQVPNLSLGYNMPTFDLGTGITNTSSASPYLKSMADIAASGNVNTDLVDRLIAETQAKANPFVRPNMFDIAGGITQTTPMRDLGIDTLPEMNPSRFTGVDLESGYLDRAGSYGQDVYAEQEKQKGGGIGGLFKFLLGLAVPGAGLLMNLPKRGLEGIRSLNQRIQNTDFGQSRTGAEYMMKRRERKQAERAQEAMPEVYRSAKEQGFTNDRGGFSTNRADKAGTSLGSGQFSPSTSRGRSGY